MCTYDRIETLYIQVPHVYCRLVHGPPQHFCAMTTSMLWATSALLYNDHLYVMGHNHLVPDYCLLVLPQVKESGSVDARHQGLHWSQHEPELTEVWIYKHLNIMHLRVHVCVFTCMYTVVYENYTYVNACTYICTYICTSPSKDTAYFLST